jgi:hypothetical protein
MAKEQVVEAVLYKRGEEVDRTRMPTDRTDCVMMTPKVVEWFKTMHAGDFIKIEEPYVDG